MSGCCFSASVSSGLREGIRTRNPEPTRALRAPTRALGSPGRTRFELRWSACCRLSNTLSSTGTPRLDRNPGLKRNRHGAGRRLRLRLRRWKARAQREWFGSCEPDCLPAVPLIAVPTSVAIKRKSAKPFAAVMKKWSVPTPGTTIVLVAVQVAGSTV